MAGLAQRIEAEPFSAKKIELLQREAPALASCTTAEVQTIVRLFQFSAEQTQALRMLFPKVVDKQNYSQAIDILGFQTDKDKLKQELNLP